MIPVLLLAASPIGTYLLYIMISLVCITVMLVVGYTWNKPPWWRTTPTPRRQVDDARDAITLMRLRKRHPEAFDADGHPIFDHHPQPDTIRPEVEDAAAAVVVSREVPT